MPMLRLTAAVVLVGLAGSAGGAQLVDSVKAQRLDEVIELLAAGADADARAADGTSALHWAAYYENADLVDRLIAAAADVDARNDYGSTPLAEAALNGNVAIVASLLRAGADPSLPNGDGQTPLMIVSRSSNVEAARLMIEHGADINARETWRGQTALMWAAAQSQPAVVRLLIEHGADVDARSFVNDWARQVSAEARRHYRPSGGLTPLLFAAREGCVECIRALVEGGADVELTDPDGVTPLFLAIDNFHYDTAKTLIEAGALPNRWDRWGRTPLYGAVDTHTIPRGGRPDRPSLDRTTALEIVEMLLAAGANPNVQLKNSLPHRSIVDDRGCDNMLNQPGPTPLLRAAKAFDVPAMRLLIAHGAAIELPNAAGITPLMAAAGLGSVECDTRGPSDRVPQYYDDDIERQSIAALTVLLEAGADLNARARTGGQGANRGQTALHGAAFWGWNDVVEFLVERGAVINASDAQERTPLHSALGRAGGNGRGGRIDVFEDTAELLVELCRRSDGCVLPEVEPGLP